MRKTHVPDALAMALAEPSRRALLENLRFGRKSVTELVNATQLKQPNVSNHLAKMRQHGIVRAERNGRQVYYSLAMPFADVLLRMHEFAANPAPVGAEALRPVDEREEKLPSRPGSGRQAREARRVEVVDWRNAYLQAVLAGEEDKLVALVNAMLSHRLDLQTIYMDIFQWCMYRIGDLYERGAVDEAREHMASAITERMMAHVTRFYTPVARLPQRAILGCVAGNRHTLGLQMLSDGLRGMGWTTFYLGADMPTRSFVEMTAQINPDLVLISCALEAQVPALETLVKELRDLRAKSQCHRFSIAVGGYSMRARPNLDREVGSDFAASDLVHFLKTITRSCGSDVSV